MQITSGYPIWPLLDGLSGPFPSLEGDVDCGVVVVGAGVTGALQAHELARRGLDVVVLEKREVGFGSTAATTGLLTYEVDASLRDLARRIGVKEATRTYGSMVDATRRVGALARRVGGCRYAARRSLYAASRESDLRELRAEYRLRRSAGIAVSFLDRAELRRGFGIDRPGAILSEDGGQVDAYALAARMLHRARRRGARVHDRTTVLEPAYDERGVRLRTEQGHVVRGRFVVWATGYEMARYLPRGLVQLAATYAILSEPLREPRAIREFPIVWETARPYLYLRTARDGRFMLGGRDEPFREANLADDVVQSKASALEADLRRLVPWAGVRAAFAWAGAFATTPDELAYVGPLPGRRRALFALGFGANGIVFGQLAADILAGEVLGRPHPDARLFSFDRASLPASVRRNVHRSRGRPTTARRPRARGRTSRALKSR